MFLQKFGMFFIKEVTNTKSMHIDLVPKTILPSKGKD
jgi:hypothetical protein